MLLNGWGIALRPPGAGGHFWISNAGSGTTTTYVGDVPGVPLFQDELKVVTIPTSRLYESWTPPRLSQPTGQVYTGWSTVDFIIPGESPMSGAVERLGPSKFIFAALDGTISDWATGMTDAVNIIDDSALGSMFSGVAVTTRASGNRLFVCDFGLETVKVYDHAFRPIRTLGTWTDPAVPPGYSAYNMLYDNGVVFVAFARVGDEPGEPDVYPGYGYISAFDEEGRLVASFEPRLEINAPWGLAIAPSDFGALSGTLLVGNFGDGTIVAFDLATRKYVDYLRTPAGAPVEIDGLWGLAFGNGVSLGQANHLYFAAGPNLELDGLFGKLAPVQP